MSMYDLEEDRLVAEITGRGARRLLIQLPDGLKSEGPRLASLVREKTGAEVFVSASSAWGACDLSLDAAARLKAYLMVHYGHNEFVREGSSRMLVFYIPAKSRHEIVEKARQTNNYGIIISTKPGQSNPTIALNIQHQLEENGKKAVLLYADEIRPEKLLDFTDVDAFVDTACPRLALDDPERFPKPIVTRDEIMVVMGAWTWEQLLERGLVRL